MEALQILIVIECVALGFVLLLAAGYLYLRIGRLTDARVIGLLAVFFYYCLPGMVGAVFPVIRRVVIPLDRASVQLAMAIALPLMVFSVLAGVFVRLGSPRQLSTRRRARVVRQIAIQYRPGALFLVSLAFFLIGLIGVYVELKAAGGWLSVIRGGGSAYLEARVTKAVGFWAVLMSFIPVAGIGMMYSVVRSRAVPRQLRWLIALAILSICIGAISLLTTRHLSMMLLLALLALLEIRAGRLFRAVAPVIFAMMIAGALALASIRYTSRSQSIDEITGNLEQVKIGEQVIGTIDVSGYIWGGNLPDLLVFMIPRSIWHTKPVNSTINRAVFFEYAKWGGVKVVGLLGEAYASGGLLWVILEGFIFGVILRRAQRVWERRRENSFQFMAYGAVILGYTYMSARMGFLGPQDATFIVMIIQIKIVNWICGYKLEQQTFEPVPALAAIGTSLPSSLKRYGIRD